MNWQLPTMHASQYIDLFIDFLPFILYTGLLGKLFVSWLSLRCIREGGKTALAAILLLASVTIVLFLASNVYTLAVYGKTFLSIRVFQMFVIANCVVYWVLIDLVVRGARKQHAEEKPSELTS